MTAKLKPATVEALRADIARLKTEIEATRRAGLPVEQVEMMLREALSLAESNYRSMTQELGRSLANGAVITLSDLMAHAQRAESVDSLLLGFAVRAVGAEAIIQDAKEAAAALPQARLRLTDAERQARLAELQEALFLAEVEEEQLVEVEGLTRRPDASTAAVLGLPFEIAEQAGLLFQGRP
jgi:hypothetical protein